MALVFPLSHDNDRMSSSPIGRRSFSAIFRLAKDDIFFFPRMHAFLLSSLMLGLLIVSKTSNAAAAFPLAPARVFSLA